MALHENVFNIRTIKRIATALHFDRILYYEPYSIKLEQTYLYHTMNISSHFLVIKQVDIHAFFDDVLVDVQHLAVFLKETMNIF